MNRMHNLPETSVSGEFFFPSSREICLCNIEPIFPLLRKPTPTWRISDGCPGNAASRRARNLEWNAGAAWASTSASAPTDKAPSTFVAARRSWKVSRSSWWAVVKHRWTATGRRAAQPAQSTSPEGGIVVGECRCPPRPEPPCTRSSWSSRWRGKLDSHGEWTSICDLCFVLMFIARSIRKKFSFSNIFPPPFFPKVEEEEEEEDRNNNSWFFFSFFFLQYNKFSYVP